MNDNPRYQPVEDILPNPMPPLTRKNAAVVYANILRMLGKASLMPVGVAEARNGADVRNHYPHLGRTCWASSKPTTGHDKGWGRLVHDASHIIFQARHPSARPHDPAHAVLEREIARYVVAQDLIARYSAKPKAKPRPTYDERIAHTRALMSRWEAKARRAQTAIRKLARRVRLAGIHRMKYVVVPAVGPGFLVINQYGGCAGYFKTEGAARYWIRRQKLTPVSGPV